MAVLEKLDDEKDKGESDGDGDQHSRFFGAIQANRANGKGDGDGADNQNAGIDGPHFPIEELRGSDEQIGMVSAIECIKAE